MKTIDQIRKKVSRLERRLGLLYKHRANVNFTKAYDVRSSSSEYDEYTKDILNIEGKIKSLEWVLDEEDI